MDRLPGFTIAQTLRDDGSTLLLRARPDADPAASVLVLTTAAEHPAAAVVAALDNEYALRERIDADTALRPLALQRAGHRPLLVLPDPGGALLGRCADTAGFLVAAIAIAQAVGRLHANGLIHRDLKPSNILWNPADGSARITGFGCAMPAGQAADAGAEAITGTLAYMAPEQTGRTHGTVDSRSDLYALGITFYELLAGAPPFTAADPMEMIHCHVARAPAPLSDHLANLPPPIEAIVLKLLEKGADDRYQTALGLAADLATCLDQWEASSSVVAFELGSRDVPTRLALEGRLYGRAAEILQLVAGFDRMCADGTPGFFLVTGAAGMGKTALVREFGEHVGHTSAVFRSGQFDPSARDIPHGLVAQAFQAQVVQVLYQDEAAVARWREALLTALGSDAQLMIDLVPELGHVLGPQPPVAALPSGEAKKRFQRAVLRLFGVFADARHPFVLFLDDLQNMDDASAELLEAVLAQRVRHLLLIGAWQGDPVAADGPLAASIDRLDPQRIALHSLAPDDLTQWLADALRSTPERTRELGAVVFQKTDGNPFFTTRFVDDLAKDKLVCFSPVDMAWRWDIEAIRARDFSDNVVDMLAGQLGRLPDAAQALLLQIACVGSGIEVATLALIEDRPAPRLHEDLVAAVRANVLLRSGDAYRFSHERIRLATYALIAPADRAARHLGIGRGLASRLVPEAIERELFMVVQQFNLGRQGVAGDTETALLRDLNARAGRRSKASTAYAVAREHLAIAAELVGAATWTSDYQDTLALHLDLLECEYLVGHFERADAISTTILEHARDKLDSARVYELRMRLYQLAGKLEDAISAGLDALKLFDIRFPDTEDALLAEVEREKPKVAANLAGRSVAQLVDAQPCRDPNIRVVIGLMADLGPCLAVVRPKSKLYALQVLKIINLSLVHGSVEKSCFLFAQYGRMLITDAGNVAAGMEFSDLALRLNEKFQDVKLKGTLTFFYGAYLHHWRRSLASNVEVLEQSLAASVAAGNYVFAGNAAYFLPTHAVGKGSSLDEVVEMCDRQIAFAGTINNQVLLQAIALYRELALSLRDDAAADLGERFAAHAAARFAPSIAGYETLRQTVCLLFEQYAEADAAGDAASKVMAPGGIAFTSNFFHGALTRIAQQRQSGVDGLAETLEALKLPRQKLRFMAESNPDNYFNRHALVEAEVAALEGRVLEAQSGYEDAVRSARDNGFVLNEALANELAGRFHLQRGLDTIGLAYLREAHQGYGRWGATRKSRQLEQAHPRLAALLRQGAKGGADNLDVMTIIKASQALSSEIVLDKVIERLMTIVLETAGAVRGLLILPEEGGWAVAAEASTGHEITVTPRDAAITAAELPVSIFQYVVRTSEDVLLDDAAASPQYVGDAYVAAHRARSVLFLPLLKQGKLVGVVYLENNLIAGAFTAERMTVLRLLNSQAAISVENARLYREREIAEQELRQHRDHLEELVEERTAIIKQKTKDIDAMLQNMDLGVCTVVSNNAIHHEYSKHLCVIFEADDFADKDVLNSLFSRSDLGADALDQISQALKSMIGEDRMMFDFNSHLLAGEMELLGDDGRRKIVKMDWSPIVGDTDVVEKVLCISQDVTQLRELELASAQQKAELDIISRIIKVAPGKFNDFTDSSRKFLADNRALLAAGGRIDREAIAVLFRNMHTVKGNSRTYDFRLVTDAAHTAEQSYDQLRNDVSLAPDTDRLLADLAVVEQALARYIEVNEDKLGRKGRAGDLLTTRGVFVPGEVVTELKTIAAGLKNPGGNESILALRRLIRGIGIVPLDRLVGGATDSLSALVKELGKPMPVVEIDDGEAGFGAQFAEALKVSFMHIVRNCLDHGIEQPADRRARDKPEAGTIRFACGWRDGRFELRIGDDGRGLALHKLYDKGVAVGLIAASAAPDPARVAELIFDSGLSTAEQVTQVSGRGVGMDAVRAALAEHGAEIGVSLDAASTTLGFTPFRFVIRIPKALVTA